VCRCSYRRFIRRLNAYARNESIEVEREHDVRRSESVPENIVTVPRERLANCRNRDVGRVIILCVTTTVFGNATLVYPPGQSFIGRIIRYGLLTWDSNIFNPENINSL